MSVTGFRIGRKAAYKTDAENYSEIRENTAKAVMTMGLIAVAFLIATSVQNMRPKSDDINYSNVENGGIISASAIDRSVYADSDEKNGTVKAYIEKGFEWLYNKLGND